MSAFWLKIVASDHIFYNGHCSYLAVPAPDGEMGIMPHHEAMILAIQEGNLRFKVPEETEWHQAIVGRGILQVANNRVTMIVDTAERPEDIDEVRAREALERAQAAAPATEPEGVQDVPGIHGKGAYQAKGKPSEGT